MAPRREVDVDAVSDDAFGLAEDYGPFSSDWHAHRRHQILFAAKGTLQLTTGTRRWTLPPERAAWIPSGERHRVESDTGIELRTVYLATAMVPDPPICRVFAVTPLAREMMLHAMRWQAGEKPSRARKAFFTALACLTPEWIADERPYFLPTAKSPALERAMRYVDGHLSDATIGTTAKAAKVSERTLARRFEEETQTTFRDYLQAARMMRAMELLARPNASVSATAHEVGFRSIGAFSTAFTERCGETPSDYRARVTR